MSKQQLFEAMETYWNTFVDQHNGTTKKSQAEAPQGRNFVSKELAYSIW